MMIWYGYVQSEGLGWAVCTDQLLTVCGRLYWAPLVGAAHIKALCGLHTAPILHSAFCRDLLKRQRQRVHPRHH